MFNIVVNGNIVRENISLPEAAIEQARLRLNSNDRVSVVADDGLVILPG